MYLARIKIENFRIFGSRNANTHGDIALHPGMNLFLGENDSGKTCVIDAVRLLLGTATFDYFTVRSEDFHVSDGTRAKELWIRGEFRGLNKEECGRFAEHIEVDDGGSEPEFYLKVWLHAEELQGPGSARKRRIRSPVFAGPGDEGRRLDPELREQLRATYLKPLRDAVAELAAKKGSRLSQILRAYPQLEGQDDDDWTGAGDGSTPKTLVGVMRRAESDLRENPVIQSAEKELNEEYLANLSIGDSALTASIGVRAHELQQILERLELSLGSRKEEMSRGLGIHNILFIATELLALSPDEEPDMPLLLVEEPEAHLHPQLQHRLIEYLGSRSKQSPIADARAVQVIMTSHSPNIACAVGLAHVTLMHRGRAFSLSPNETRMEASDYGFLERFLDVTKANLFFAKGVLIVEGAAEALLLPALARRMGRSLSKYGVTIVNVGHVGLFRYARIFQRKSNIAMPIRVGCVTDRDVPPVEATPYLQGRKTEAAFGADEIKKRIDSRKQHDGGSVLTFVSPKWTLEHDLAIGAFAKYVHAAVRLARHAKRIGTIPVGAAARGELRSALVDLRGWSQAGRTDAEIAATVYEPLYKRTVSKAETAQWLAQLLGTGRRLLQDELPEYLVSAISYVTGADK